MTRRAAIGALVFAAVTSLAMQVALAAMDKADLRGAPPAFETGKKQVVYVWTDSSGLHLRWTSDGKPVVYTGQIELNQAAGEVARFNKRGGGWIDKPNENTVMFSATATAGLDGADFSPPKGTKVRLDLQVDGSTVAASAVFVGAKLANPETIPFEFKVR